MISFHLWHLMEIQRKYIENGAGKHVNEMMGMQWSKVNHKLVIAFPLQNKLSSLMKEDERYKKNCEDILLLIL